MAIPAAAHADGLVAHWSFDEGTGQTVHDDGPFGLDGTLGASAAPDAADPAWISGGLRFDGTGFVTLPASPRLALQTLTVEATVRADASPGAYRYVVSRGGRGCWSGSYGLYSAEGGGIAFYVFDGHHYVVSATARIGDVWDGAWHRIDGTFDGRTLRLYVDGRPVGAPMAAPMTVDYSTTGGGAALGTYAGRCNLPFVGDLDDVRILDGPEQGAAPAAPDPEPLPALAPGRVIQAAAAPPGTTLTGPIANAPACRVALSRHTVVVHRRTVVRAHVASRRAKVTARPSEHGRALASVRADKAGNARLVLRPRATGRVTVSAAGCAPATLKVTK